MTWRTLTERDCCEWKLYEVDPCDRDVEIQCEICHALPGREPIDVDDAPASTC